MTKSELIKALDNINDDTEILIGYAGQNEPYYLDKIEIGERGFNKGRPILRTDDAPEFDALCEIADATYEEWGEHMKDWEIKALSEISDKAAKGYAKIEHERWKELHG